MRSRYLIVFLMLLVFIGATVASAATLVPVPLKVPKGAYVNADGINAKDNFFWQQVTLTPAAAHANGAAFTITLPDGMSIADVNYDSNYDGEPGIIWKDLAGADLTSLVLKSVNATRTALRFTVGYNDVTNGDFLLGSPPDRAPGWNLTNVSYNNVQTRLDFAATGVAYQDLDLVDGNKYTVVYTITVYAAGAMNVSLGGTALTPQSALGTYVETVAAGTTDNRLTFTSAGGTKSIDDVFVIPYELTETFTDDATGWELGTGWAWDATNKAKVATGSASNGNLVYNIGAVPGQKYIVKFTASVAGIKPRIGGTLGSDATGAAEIQYLTAGTNGGSLEFVPTAPAAWTGSIDDVEVQPVGVHDGAFDLGAGANTWVEGANWAIAGGGGAVKSAGLDNTLAQPIGAANGETYTIIFDVTAWAAGGNVTIGVGGATTTVSVTAIGQYMVTITATGAGNLIFDPFAAADAYTIDNVIVLKHSAVAVGDYARILLPVVTLQTPGVTTDDYYIDFADGATDDITNGNGTAITYVDPGAESLSLASFTADFTGEHLTNALGDRYPTSAAPSLSALPDFIDDDSGTAHITPPNVGVTLEGTDSNEVRYALWISTEPNLAHIDSTLIQFAIQYPGLARYYAFEGGTAGTQYSLVGLPEGSFYVYVTSYLTGDYPLARSGKLNVRHWPVVAILGNNKDHDLLYTPGGVDDGDVTLDSGYYYNYDGTPSATERYTWADLYTKVNDIDDNAKVHLFYSTQNDRADTTYILTSGSRTDGTLAVTGLTGATIIKANLLENQLDEQGYIKYRWNVHPDSLHVILAAGDYSIYTVTTDGKHLGIQNMTGSGVANLYVKVKHSPNLTIDTLDSGYDSAPLTTGTQINVQNHDVIMLSWGKNGVSGADDYNDSAVIEFYIAADANTDNISDYKYDDAAALRAAAAATPATAHKIVGGIAENFDSKNNMWYEWNLKTDFQSSGWSPVAGTTYFIYGIIDENKTTNNIARVVSIGSSFPDDTLVTGTNLSANKLVFTNSPFSRLIDPPAEGVTVNAEQTYRLRFNAFDWDTNANIGVFAVKNTSTGFVDGPDTTSVAVLDNANVVAYMLNDDDGDYRAGNTTVLENTEAYYDATIRVPGSLTAKYVYTTGNVETTLANGTYWVYLGSWKGTIFLNLVTNGTLTGSASVIANWGPAGTAAYGTNNVNLGAAGTITQNIGAVVANSYQVNFTVSNISGGCTVTPSITAAGTGVTANGTYSQVIKATGASLVFTSSVGGTATIDNIIVTNAFANGGFANADGWTADGVGWTAPAGDADHVGGTIGSLTQDVSALSGRSYTLTYKVTAYTDGSVTASIGGTAGTPRSAVGTYTETIVAGTANTLLAFTAGLNDDLSIDDVTLTPLPVPLYRAPGTLKVVNAGVAAPQRNISVSPMEVTVAQGDTVAYTLRVADAGGSVDRVDAYIAVEKDFWTVVNSTTPFTAGTGFTGKVIGNSTIDDTANNRWILRAVVSNSGGSPFTIIDDGVGDALVTFKLVSKGTTMALEGTSSVYFVNEPVNGRVTKFSNDGIDISVNLLPGTVKVIPRAIIEGIVELQGRSTNAVPITFELRKRGSYVATVDTAFINKNDANAAVRGAQLTPDSDGKFTLLKVPSGEYDLVAAYDRYLSKLIQVNVYPGIDTLFVNFGTLPGGDCYGYVDSTGAVFPDNQITTDDLNRVQSAFLATSASANWIAPNNWKWADINEDGVVEVDDLSIVALNSVTDQNGAQPYYKAAASPAPVNGEPSFEFTNVPGELVAGQTYTIQVIGRNIADIRAYFVNMNYDSGALTFNGIRKGDFIQSDSYSFPVIGNATVGLANSATSFTLSSGDGVLAEVSFTSKRNGAFTSDMLGFERVSLADAAFHRESLLVNQTAGTGSDMAPLAFNLSQNYPNPFNPTTVINFSIPENSSVKLDVYDILGRHVRTLVNGFYSPGRHAVVWDSRDENGSAVSAGVYIYTIAAGNNRSARKMILIK